MRSEIFNQIKSNREAYYARLNQKNKVPDCRINMFNTKKKDVSLLDFGKKSQAPDLIIKKSRKILSFTLLVKKMNLFGRYKISNLLLRQYLKSCTFLVEIRKSVYSSTDRAIENFYDFGSYIFEDKSDQLQGGDSNK